MYKYIKEIIISALKNYKLYQKIETFETKNACITVESAMLSTSKCFKIFTRIST